MSAWIAEFPDLFYSGMGISPQPGTLKLFAQYSLMYLLRKRYGARSITFYQLSDTSKNSKNRNRTEEAWKTMRRWMGSTSFEALRTAVLNAGFIRFKGEPDLFCWRPENGSWFFAEAKNHDKLTPSQVEWFQVCQNILGGNIDIRVYTLVPDNTSVEQPLSPR